MIQLPTNSTAAFKPGTELVRTHQCSLYPTDFFTKSTNIQHQIQHPLLVQLPPAAAMTKAHTEMDAEDTGAVVRGHDYRNLILYKASGTTTLLGLFFCGAKNVFLKGDKGTRLQTSLIGRCGLRIR